MKSIYPIEKVQLLIPGCYYPIKLSIDPKDLIKVLPVSKWKDLHVTMEVDGSSSEFIIYSIIDFIDTNLDMFQKPLWKTIPGHNTFFKYIWPHIQGDPEKDNPVYGYKETLLWDKPLSEDPSPEILMGVSGFYMGALKIFHDAWMDCSDPTSDSEIMNNIQYEILNAKSKDALGYGIMAELIGYAVKNYKDAL